MALSTSFQWCLPRALFDECDDVADEALALVVDRVDLSSQRALGRRASHGIANVLVRIVRERLVDGVERRFGKPQPPRRRGPSNLHALVANEAEECGDDVLISASLALG